MKLRVLTLLGLLAFGAGSMIQAQDYDDIYYDGSSSSTKVKKETKKVETRAGRTTVEILPASYRTTAASNYRVDRDVDEYNRHGIAYDENYQPVDTLVENTDVFANTKRIERFYNPDIVIHSGDVDLVEIYYDDTPTINLIIGTNYGYSPRVGWGWGWGNYWYDPWYTYDPFYCTGWYGYYRPWGWSWGWGRPWGYTWGYTWGWGPRYHYAAWGPGWGRPYHGYYHGRGYYNGRGYTAGRRPGDHRSTLAGAANRPYSGGRSGVGGSGVRSGNTRSGVGSINNGRQRPSSYGSSGSGMSTGRQRPSSTVGNTGSMGRSSSSNTSGWSNGSVRSRGSSSSYGTSRSSSSSRSYSPSRSSSSGYSGSTRSSSGYSSGSGRSGGGYSGGGRSGGGGHSGGGGGGGHRR